MSFTYIHVRIYVKNICACACMACIHTRARGSVLYTYGALVRKSGDLARKIVECTHKQSMQPTIKDQQLGDVSEVIAGKGSKEERIMYIER